MSKNSCQKKANFFRNFRNKSHSIFMLHKIDRKKNVLLNWYSPRKFFLERFGWVLTLKIDFENQISAFFDGYFWPFNKSHEKINTIFLISAIMASIWNVFIKFGWPDEIFSLRWYSFGSTVHVSFVILHQCARMHANAYV